MQTSNVLKDSDLEEYNSQETLMEWAQQVVARSKTMDDIQKHEARKFAAKVIEGGGLRGDVSGCWVRLGYNHDDLDDLFL